MLNRGTSIAAALTVTGLFFWLAPIHGSDDFNAVRVYGSDSGENSEEFLLAVEAFLKSQDFEFDRTTIAHGFIWATKPAPETFINCNSSKLGKPPGVICSEGWRTLLPVLVRQTSEAFEVVEDGLIETIKPFEIDRIEVARWNGRITVDYGPFPHDD